MKFSTATAVAIVLLTSPLAYGQGLTVSATSGQTTPYWAAVGDQTITPVSAALTNPPSFVGGPNYAWTFTNVLYSQDTSPPTAPAAGGYYAYFEDPASPQTTNFDATLYNAGYWHFDLKVTVTGTVQQGSGVQGVSGSATCAADPVAAGALTVLRQPDGGNAYVAIDNTNNSVLPGEYIDLEANDPAGGAVTAVQWTIPTKGFKTYTADAKAGTLTPLADTDLKAQTVQFHWADSGDKQVQVQAKVGGQPKMAKAALSVKKPTATLTAAQGDMYVGNYGKDTLKDGDHLRLILAKDNMGGLPGMAFTGSVTVPDGFAQGKWCFVQIMTLKSTDKITAGGTSLTAVEDTKGEFVLDTTFPYGAEHDTGATAQDDSDSPNLVLDKPLTNAELTYGDFTDTFKWYILFKPSGANSCYVPLMRKDWSCKGAAQKTAGKWGLVSGSAGKTNSDSVEDTTHPVWTKNITDFGYELQP